MAACAWQVPDREAGAAAPPACAAMCCHLAECPCETLVTLQHARADASVTSLISSGVMWYRLVILVQLLNTKYGGAVVHTFIGFSSCKVSLLYCRLVSTKLRFLPGNFTWECCQIIQL